MLNRKLIHNIVSIILSLAILLTPLSIYGNTNGSSSTPNFTSKFVAAKYLVNEVNNFNRNVKFTLTCKENDSNKLIKYFNSNLYYESPINLDSRGDYLRFSILDNSNLRCRQTKYSNSSKIHYTFTYTLNYKITKSEQSQFNKELKKVMFSLNLSNLDAYNRTKAIYDYICSTVTYDSNSPSTYIKKYTAYAALINKTAVCQGYASLMYIMCKEANIPVRIIYGTSDGETHSWNIVKIDGKWYNVDSTWDSILSSHNYFLKSDDCFPNHIRAAKYYTDYFKSNYPMSDENYKYKWFPKIKLFVCNPHICYTLVK